MIELAIDIFRRLLLVGHEVCLSEVVEKLQKQQIIKIGAT